MPYNREWCADRRARNLAQGLCYAHGKPVRPGRTSCQLCFDIAAKRAVKRKAERLAQGLCPRDSNPLVAGRESCQVCLDSALRIATKRYKRKGKQIRAENKRKYYADLEKSRATGREQSQRWREADRDRARQVIRRFVARNPDKVRARTHFNRIQRKGLRGSSFTGPEWTALKKLHGHRCIACGKHVRTLRKLGRKLVPDHVVALSDPSDKLKGMRGLISNIQPLCHGAGGCNNAKGAKHIDYR